MKVSEYRGSIEHLERVFNYDRHSAVGEFEKDNWRGICIRVLAELKRLECKRAKPADTYRAAAIIVKVEEYLKNTLAPIKSPLRLITRRTAC